MAAKASQYLCSDCETVLTSASLLKKHRSDDCTAAGRCLDCGTIAAGAYGLRNHHNDQCGATKWARLRGRRNTAREAREYDALVPSKTLPRCSYCGTSLSTSAWEDYRLHLTNDCMSPTAVETREHLRASDERLKEHASWEVAASLSPRAPHRFSQAFADWTASMWISAVCIVSIPLMIVVGIMVVVFGPHYEPPATSSGAPGVVPASSGRDVPGSGGADTAGDAYLHTSMLAHCTGGAGLSEAKCRCIIGGLETKYGIRGAYDMLLADDEQTSIDAVRRLGC